MGRTQMQTTAGVGNRKKNSFEMITRDFTRTNVLKSENQKKNKKKENEAETKRRKLEN